MTNEQEKINEIFSRLSARTESYREYLDREFSRYAVVCIFGMGALGRVTANVLLEQKLRVDCFCDNNPEKTGTTYRGIPCVGLGELSEEKDGALVLIATVHYREIYSQLSGAGFGHLDRILMNKFEVDDYLSRTGLPCVKESVEKLFQILADEESRRVMYKLLEGWAVNRYENGMYDDIACYPQYFLKDIVPPKENEVFVDAGAYEGDTLEDFLQYSNGRFQKAFLFELNENTRRALQKKVDALPENVRGRIQIRGEGLSDSKRTVTYGDDAAASCLREGGPLEGRLTDLDSALGGEPATFIKMDIEGEEQRALKGMERTIRTCKPRMAVCIYHRAEDYWNIPLYLKKLVPDYQIYIRHHTDLSIETVCYAVAGGEGR